MLWRVIARLISLEENLQSIEVWKKGRQEGITTLFQDGIKVEEVPYAEGMRNGKALIYKEGLDVIKEVSWKNDKLHGPTHTYIDGIKRQTGI